MDMKHKVHEPYGIRPSTAPRVRDMKVGQIAQIVAPQYTEARVDSSVDLHGRYIMRTKIGVVFLDDPMRGWYDKASMQRMGRGGFCVETLEHAIRILPVGATVEITVGV